MIRKLIRHLVTNVWFDVDARIYGIPISIGPPHVWWVLLNSPGERFGIFRREVKGAWHDYRWGFYILGFEVGTRGGKTSKEDTIVLQKLSIKALNLAEKFFLISHGWRELHDGWYAPSDYPKEKKGVHQAHAINSMKKR